MYGRVRDDGNWHPGPRRVYDRRPGSCGKPLPIYEIKLFNDEDNEVPVGEPGEIVFRPREPFTMMLEYYNMPDKTLETFRNLWFHTGDLAKRDGDSYFYFIDRKKDSLRRRGENISSFEVERAINSHPSVLESAAVAVESELGEDEVKICVVLKPGATLTPEELIDFATTGCPTLPCRDLWSLWGVCQKHRRSVYKNISSNRRASQQTRGTGKKPGTN